MNFKKKNFAHQIGINCDTINIVSMYHIFIYIWGNWNFGAVIKGTENENHEKGHTYEGSDAANKKSLF